MHQDPAVFSEPEAFRPERWTADFEAQMHRYSYFPFGGGPRMCIGAAFADLEAKIVLATFLRRFKPHVLSAATLEVVPSLTQRPRHGLPVQLQPW
jgi:cytochrome P450